MCCRLWQEWSNRSTLSPLIPFCRSSRRCRRRRESTCPWFVWFTLASRLPTSRTLHIITWRRETRFTCFYSLRAANDTERARQIQNRWLKNIRTVYMRERDRLNGETATPRQIRIRSCFAINFAAITLIPLKWKKMLAIMSFPDSRGVILLSVPNAFF